MSWRTTSLVDLGSSDMRCEQHLGGAVR